MSSTSSAAHARNISSMSPKITSNFITSKRMYFFFSYTLVQGPHKTFPIVKTVVFLGQSAKYHYFQLNVSYFSKGTLVYFKLLVKYKF